LPGCRSKRARPARALLCAAELARGDVGYRSLAFLLLWGISSMWTLYDLASNPLESIRMRAQAVTGRCTCAEGPSSTVDNIFFVIERRNDPAGIRLGTAANANDQAKQ